jgi:hypothetical protein
MTLRDYLNRNIRRSTICCWIGILPALIGGFIHGYIRIVGLVIAGVFYLVALYHTYSARCPRCRTMLLVAEATFGIHLAIPKWFDHCPSCGLSFDTQLAASRGPNQTLQPL